MSRLSILQSQLADVQARLVVLRTAWDKAADHKGYSLGFGESSATRQDFATLDAAYKRLQAEERSLSEQIDILNGTETGSSVAVFTTP